MCDFSHAFSKLHVIARNFHSFITQFDQIGITSVLVFQQSFEHRSLTEITINVRKMGQPPKTIMLYLT